MTALKNLLQRHPQIGPVLGTVICVGLFAERARSFAQTQQDSADPARNSEPATPVTTPVDVTRTTSPTSSVPSVTEEQKKIDLPIQIAPPAAGAPAQLDQTQKRSRKATRESLPLELKSMQQFDKVKTKQDACAQLEGKIVNYYDSSAIIISCVQRPIEDPDLLNELVYKQKKSVTEIPARIYRLIPFGEPFTATESLTTSKVCRELNGKYMTSTGSDYYYVEDCKKRPFANYVDLQAHNKLKAPVVTVSPDRLDKIPDGKPLEGDYNREVRALYKIVGDSTISPLSNNDGRSKPVSSAEELEKLPGQSRKNPTAKNTCKELEGKVVSFYSQLFLISDCKKRFLKDLPVSVQKQFSERGIRIVDVSASQLDLMPAGKDLEEDEALDLIK